MASSSLSVHDLYFSALHDEESLFPISDEKFAEELQLQEAIASSLFTSKPDNAESSRSKITFCIICTDAKSAAEMFASGLCSHSFCSDCVSKHIAAKLQCGIAVNCPQPNCAAALQPEMCGSFVPREVMERWGDALFEAAILKMKRVYCPFEDCSAVMIDDEAVAVTEVECLSCRRLFCAQCKVGWHGGMECGEFEKWRREGGRNREETMTMKFVNEKKWKRCPNCRIFVEKNQGCNHITCRCGSQFCYVCGSQWKNNHTC